MNRDEIDHWLERSILCLALALLVLMVLAFGGYPQEATGVFLDPILADPFVIAEWLTLGMILLWLVRLWLRPKSRLFWPPVSWAVVAFLVYAVIRYFQADIEYVARQEVIQVLVYAAFFLVVVNNLHRQEGTQALVIGLVLLGLFISFYGLFQFITNSTHVWHLVTPYKHRASGPYICPNHFGGFLEMVIPLGVAAALLSRLQPTLKIVLGYAAVAMLAAVAVSLSRGAWVGTVVALLLVFGTLLFNRRFRIPALVCVVLLAAAAHYFVPKSFFIQTRAESVVTEQGTLNDSFRFSLWPPAYAMWKDHLWLGAGPGHFDYLFGKYRPPEVQASPDRVHNDYLNTLTDWGIVGAALVTFAFVLLAVGVKQTWRKVRISGADFGRKSGSTKFAVLLGASAGLVAILCHSAVDFNMHVPANALVAVTLMALVTTHLRFVTEDYWHRLGIASQVAASLALAMFIGALGYEAWRHSTESYWLAQAGRQEDASPEQVQFLRRAAAAEPQNGATASNLAEALRKQSLAGSDDAGSLATTATDWFRTAIHLNPWDAHAHLGLGMSLDWLGRHAEAEEEFLRAEEVDPNNYFVVAHVGWHYVNTGDYAAARVFLERSNHLMWNRNPIAENYLALANQRLQAAATSELSIPLAFPAP